MTYSFNFIFFEIKNRIIKRMKGCHAQKTKKYVSRESPPYPANKCCGMVLVGNTGAMYKSTRNRLGICRWVKTGKRGRHTSGNSAAFSAV